MYSIILAINAELNRHSSDGLHSLQVMRLLRTYPCYPDRRSPFQLSVESLLSETTLGGTVHATLNWPAALLSLS